MPDYKSGFCDMGAHEGDNPKNFAGKPVPTCRMTSEQCSCDCHVKFDEMYKMADMDRVTVNNSSYVPERADFIMPDLNELVEARLASGRATATLERIESPDPTLVPATIARTYAPTATGRSARGELEQQVDAVCKVWIIDGQSELCTPKYISEEIERTVGIKAPSVGAIGAVFDRWVDLGYAVCERKPVRFTGYTDLAREVGLDGCKERARRTKAKAR